MCSMSHGLVISKEFELRVIFCYIVFINSSFVIDFLVLLKDNVHSTL